MVFSAVLLIGCNEYSSYKGFPQDQEINGPFEVSASWQELRLDPPLEINRGGVQWLHLFVDGSLYLSHGAVVREDIANHSNLWRHDGVLVAPEVVLIANTGKEVSVAATANMGTPTGELSVGFSMFESIYKPAPPFPASIQNFVAVRVRSNEPLQVNRIRWSVDSHPDLYRCLGECPWWRFW